MPLVALILVWCLVPRSYYTGTNSVNALTLTAPVSPGQSVCATGLNLPADTARIQVQVGSGGLPRSELTMKLVAAGRTYESSVPAAHAPSPIERVAFPIPQRPSAPQSVPASLCLRAVGVVGWGVTPTLEATEPPITIGREATNQRLAVWYLPADGVQRSYLAEVGSIFHRAALFAAGFVRPWLFGAVLFGLLPLLALLSVRLLAVSVSGLGRRVAVWLYVLAALNGAAWAVITPPFQAPDEVDHFAYVQSVVEDGHSPTPYPSAKLNRWSTAQNASMLGSAFFTDHQLADSRTPWLDADTNLATQLQRRLGPRRADGGGYEGASGYGPLYYLALTPGYALASSGSTFSQLLLMRLLSALIGALTSVFVYLLVRELAPRRAWLGVVAGLLVSFQPMYSFISGSVNNDVGIDAGAAAVAFLLVRAVRHGLTWKRTAPIGLLLGLLPFVKGSAYDFYPITALAVGAVLWRDRSQHSLRERSSWYGLGALIGVGVVALAAGQLLTGALRPSPPFPGAMVAVATAGGTITNALHAPLSFLTYLWEIFLPRLPGMHPHFPTGLYPASTIFVHTSWAAFGWNNVVFPSWVYRVLGAAIVGGGVLGLRAIWRERAFVRAHWVEIALLVLVPIVVVAGVEAVFYTQGRRGVITEFGRYEFPAIAAFAALVIGALHGFGRRWLPAAAAGLVVAMIAFGYASQLLMLTTFYG